MRKKQLAKIFSNKTAIIVGASEGIGKAIAKRFYELGSNICIISRREDVLNATKKEILLECAPHTAQSIIDFACDATDQDAFKPLIEEFVSHYGIPDFLINNVGCAVPDYIDNYTLQDFSLHMQMNYYGQLIPTLALCPHFIKQKSGHIVFISSLAAYLGIIGYSAYTPAKAAVTMFAETLKHELSLYGIGVSVVLPADVKTPGFEKENKRKPIECLKMSEKAKLLSTEKIADALISGLIKKQFYITPGDARLYFFLKRYFPNTLLKIAEKELAKIRQKLGKSTAPNRSLRSAIFN